MCNNNICTFIAMWLNASHISVDTVFVENTSARESSVKRFDDWMLCNVNIYFYIMLTLPLLLSDIIVTATTFDQTKPGASHVMFNVPSSLILQPKHLCHLKNNLKAFFDNTYMLET